MDLLNLLAFAVMNEVWQSRQSITEPLDVAGDFFSPHWQQARLRLTKPLEAGVSHTGLAVEQLSKEDLTMSH